MTIRETPFIFMEFPLEHILSKHEVLEGSLHLTGICGARGS